MTEQKNAQTEYLKIKKSHVKSDGCLNIFDARIRFILLALVLLCLTSIWSNILCFNFAIICINNQGKNATFVSNHVKLNDSTLLSLKNNTDDHEHKQIYSSQQLLSLTSIVAAAAIPSYFFTVSLVNRFGIRVIFTVVGLLSGISTLFLPLAIENGYYYVIYIRIIQGIAFSSSFPVIGSFSSKWTYYKQNGFFISALVAYIQLSPAITMPISGTLCTSNWGWPSVFIVHGFFCIALFITFAILYRNNPVKHPLINKLEQHKIAVGKTELSKKALKNIPYKEILKTGAVWAVWIAAIGNFFCVNMMFLFSPNYLHSVLKFPVRNTGFSASIPPLAQFAIKILAGITSDKITFLSETNKLRLFNSIAFFGSGFFLIILAICPVEYAKTCLMLLGCAAGILGCTTGGFFKAGPLVSKHYSHFVTGNISLVITLTMLVVPIVVTIATPNQTANEWQIVFLCTATILILTNILFILMITAKPSSWTTDEFTLNTSKNKVHNVISNTRTNETFTTQVTLP